MATMDTQQCEITENPGPIVHLGAEKDQFNSTKNTAPAVDNAITEQNAAPSTAQTHQNSTHPTLPNPEPQAPNGSIAHDVAPSPSSTPLPPTQHNLQVASTTPEDPNPNPGTAPKPHPEHAQQGPAQNTQSAAVPASTAIATTAPNDNNKQPLADSFTVPALRQHHLLKHTLPVEQRGANALAHFGTDNVQEAIQKIHSMVQRQLQLHFAKVYGVKSNSNNNSWLRKKLLEGKDRMGTSCFILL